MNPAVIALIFFVLLGINFYPSTNGDTSDYSIQMELVNGNKITERHELPKDVTISIGEHRGSYYAFYRQECGLLLKLPCATKIRNGVINIDKIEKISDQ